MCSLSSFAFAEEKITVSAYTDKSSYYPKEKVELRLKIKNTDLAPYSVKIFIQWDIFKAEYQSAEMLLETGEAVESEIKKISDGILSLSIMDISPSSKEGDIFKVILKLKHDASFGKAKINLSVDGAEIISPEIELSIGCKQHIADKVKDKYLNDVRLGCENGATIIHTCLRCSTEFLEEVPPLGHDTPKWDEVAPTCTKKGERVAECKRCDKTLKEEIPALCHKFSDWVISKQASCIEDGKRERSCPTCGEKEIEIIESKGHKFSDAVIIKNPTDKETGISEKRCKVCSASLKEIIAKLEKTETEKPSEATKEENNNQNQDTSSKIESISSPTETSQEESKIIEEITEEIEIKEEDKNESSINLIPIIIILSAVLATGLSIFLIFSIKRKTKVYNPELNKEQLPF